MDPRFVIPESLLDLLTEIDNASHSYKDKHISDGLYDGLEKMLREEFKNTNLDYVDDFADTFGKLRFFHRRTVECEQKKEKLGSEFKTYTFQQTSIAKNVRQPLERLVKEIGLFRKADGISKKEQEICDEALKSLESLEVHAKEIEELKL